VKGKSKKANRKSDEITGKDLMGGGREEEKDKKRTRPCGRFPEGEIKRQRGGTPGGGFARKFWVHGPARSRE